MFAFWFAKHAASARSSPGFQMDIASPMDLASRLASDFLRGLRMLAPKNTLLQRNNRPIEGCIPKVRTKSYFDRFLQEDLEKAGSLFG
jgi:hypothetical protein